MVRKGHLFCLGVFLLITVAILAAGEGDIQIDKAPDEGGVPAKLSPEDKAQLIEFFRVKKIFGSRVWPGLGEAGIPLIQYNARYEFLIAHPGPPPPWAVVDDDTFLGFSCVPGHSVQRPFPEGE
jgi:hypothetical protein